MDAWMGGWVDGWVDGMDVLGDEQTATATGSHRNRWHDVSVPQCRMTNVTLHNANINVSIHNNGKADV